MRYGTSSWTYLGWQGQVYHRRDRWREQQPAVREDIARLVEVGLEQLVEVNVLVKNQLKATPLRPFTVCVRWSAPEGGSGGGGGVGDCGCVRLLGLPVGAAMDDRMPSNMLARDGSFQYNQRPESEVKRLTSWPFVSPEGLKLPRQRLLVPCSKDANVIFFQSIRQSHCSG